MEVSVRFICMYEAVGVKHPLTSPLMDHMMKMCMGKRKYLEVSYGCRGSESVK